MLTDEKPVIGSMEDRLKNYFEKVESLTQDIWGAEVNDTLGKLKSLVDAQLHILNTLNYTLNINQRFRGSGKTDFAKRHCVVHEI
jgi:hypothetical protein